MRLKPTRFIHIYYYRIDPSQLISDSTDETAETRLIFSPDHEYIKDTSRILRTF